MKHVYIRVGLFNYSPTSFCAVGENQLTLIYTMSLCKQVLVGQ